MGVPQHQRRPRECSPQINAPLKTQSRSINNQFPVIPRLSVTTVFTGQIHDHGDHRASPIFLYVKTSLADPRYWYFFPRPNWKDEFICAVVELKYSIIINTAFVHRHMRHKTQSSKLCYIYSLSKIKKHLRLRTWHVWTCHVYFWQPTTIRFSCELRPLAEGTASRKQQPVFLLVCYIGWYQHVGILIFNPISANTDIMLIIPCIPYRFCLDSVLVKVIDVTWKTSTRVLTSIRSQKISGWGSRDWRSGCGMSQWWRKMSETLIVAPRNT